MILASIGAKSVDVSTSAVAIQIPLGYIVADSYSGRNGVRGSVGAALDSKRMVGNLVVGHNGARTNHHGFVGWFYTRTDVIDANGTFSKTLWQRGPWCADRTK